MSEFTLKFRFSLKKRLSIYEKLMSYTKEGFPVYDSLIKFKQRYDKKKDFRGEIIGIWISRMKHGASFSTAISGWVPEAELNLISSGEEGPGVSRGLEEAIKFSNSASKIKKVIIGGSIYPIILVLMVLGFLAMFGVKMAPTFLTFLSVDRWTTSGQMLYHASLFVINDWFVVLILLAITSVVVQKTIPIWTGRTREIFDKLPPWSIYKTYYASAFLISLSSMMGTGTPIHDSIKRMKKSASPWLNVYLDRMILNLKKGNKNFGMTLNVGLLDEETSLDVIDYSELGKFEKAIYVIGERSLDESLEKIETQMALAKNLLLALVGVTVGMVYFTSMELNSLIAEAASRS